MPHIHHHEIIKSKALSRLSSYAFSGGAKENATYVIQKLYTDQATQTWTKLLKVISNEYSSLALVDFSVDDAEKIQKKLLKDKKLSKKYLNSYLIEKISSIDIENQHHKKTLFNLNEISSIEILLDNINEEELSSKLINDEHTDSIINFVIMYVLNIIKTLTNEYINRSLLSTKGIENSYKKITNYTNNIMEELNTLKLNEVILQYTNKGSCEFKNILFGESSQILNYGNIINFSLTDVLTKFNTQIELELNNFKEEKLFKKKVKSETKLKAYSLAITLGNTHIKKFGQPHFNLIRASIILLLDVEYSEKEIGNMYKRASTKYTFSENQAKLEILKNELTEDIKNSNKPDTRHATLKLITNEKTTD